VFCAYQHWLRSPDMRETIKVYLLGHFSIQCGNLAWKGAGGSKVQELLCYLISHRQFAQTRESLASLFWGDTSSEQSKKHLRQTLWRMHSCCSSSDAAPHQRLIVVDGEHVQLNPEIDWWVDVAEFERIYAWLKRLRELDSGTAQSARQAVELYRGDFLEGCYHDWCLYERERLQNMFLATLDKLICYCLENGEYKEGLQYGKAILHHNPVSERAQTQVMKLYYLSGDRTAALQQFERCRKALKEELGVAPTRSTLELLDLIRADHLNAPFAVANQIADSPPKSANPPNSLSEILGRLKQFQVALSQMQLQIQQDIQTIEQLLPEHGDQK
jgi:DNA-binding SARP family transcriptional activator